MAGSFLPRPLRARQTVPSPVCVCAGSGPAVLTSSNHPSEGPVSKCCILRCWGLELAGDTAQLTALTPFLWGSLDLSASCRAASSSAGLVA